MANTNSSVSYSFLYIDMIEFNLKLLCMKGLTILRNQKIKQLQNILWEQTYKYAFVLAIKIL